MVGTSQGLGGVLLAETHWPCVCSYAAVHLPVRSDLAAEMRDASREPLQTISTQEVPPRAATRDGVRAVFL